MKEIAVEKQSNSSDSVVKTNHEYVLLRKADEKTREVSSDYVHSELKANKTSNFQKVASFKIGFLPVTLKLYDHLSPTLRFQLWDCIKQICKELKSDKFEMSIAPLVSTSLEIKREYDRFVEEEVDLLVVAHLSYAPSGEILPALGENVLPLLLWPAQSMSELIVEKYDSGQMLLNHGIHGTQDLANMLRRQRKACGILHGHYKDAEFRRELLTWAQAARVIKTMKNSNPVNLGGYFENMLDLQLEKEKFIRDIGVTPHKVDLNEFVSTAKMISPEQINRRINFVKSVFNISPHLSKGTLSKAIRHELALRMLLGQYNSHAVGVNFQNLCNHKQIADSLHFAAGSIMADGYGYGAEGDWVTAMFLRGLLTVDDHASFTEMFSVGYANNQIVLRHWGEANPLLANSKPAIRSSVFSQEDICAELAIFDFEFQPGPVTLINLNTDPDSNGQIISISGNLIPKNLSAIDGPRAIFEPDGKSVASLLTDYAEKGGSHHLVLVREDCSQLLRCVAKFRNWLLYQL